LVCFHAKVGRWDLLVLLLVGWPERSFSLFFKLRKTKDVACAIGRMAGLAHFKLRAH
jgi:hypothetical protein